MTFTSDSDKITRDCFDSLLLETRYLDSAVPSTSMELFGERFESPIMTAALSHLDNVADNGMTVYAKAAAICNAVHWVGMGSDDELERVVGTGARTVKIIKPLEDEDEISRKIGHAVGAGCFAVGMDIDHSFNSRGGCDEVFGLRMQPKTEAQIAEYVRSAGIPFIVKGVLSPVDARKCLRAGCAGIVVSHHHGMMPFSVAPIMVLPDILEAVEHRIPVFVDCGIESGMDAYKCLAMGAKAVSVGRHLMPYLKEGAEAVAQRIREMNDELAGVMARTGVRDLAGMDPGVIHRRTF